MRVRVTVDYYDRDGVLVNSGSVGELVKMGRGRKMTDHFYNIISDGVVISVTVGKPEFIEELHD